MEEGSASCIPPPAIADDDQVAFNLVPKAVSRQPFTTAAPLREIAPTVAFDPEGRLLLQLRDDKPGILFPGMIGLFGGHREGTETFLECAVRELEEELSYSIPPARFERIATRKGIDTEVSGGTVCAEIFVVRDIPVEKVTVTEGSLLIVEVSQLAELEHRLTPSARFALEKALPGRLKSAK